MLKAADHRERRIKDWRTNERRRDALGDELCGLRPTVGANARSREEQPILRAGQKGTVDPRDADLHVLEGLEDVVELRVDELRQVAERLSECRAPVRRAEPSSRNTLVTSSPRIGSGGFTHATVSATAIYSPVYRRVTIVRQLSLSLFCSRPHRPPR